MTPNKSFNKEKECFLEEKMSSFCLSGLVLEPSPLVYRYVILIELFFHVWCLAAVVIGQKSGGGVVSEETSFPLAWKAMI